MYMTASCNAVQVAEDARLRAQSRRLTLQEDWCLALFLYSIWLTQILLGVHIAAKHLGESGYYRSWIPLLGQFGIVAAVILGHLTVSSR